VHLDGDVAHSRGHLGHDDFVEDATLAFTAWGSYATLGGRPLIGEPAGGAA
jgi:hypothetical protein